ncbi:aliphatic sulfonate ABC transporter substrate-binding protein [Paraburkholderia caballeronis]|uniref:Putative aliphatic sulfonates-binding protein n=1 Tax=Paraburkholderia caballeronis TaxID=416943 RepID=A0A1H7LJJ7_9BURK|nr:aliphatic sulfonate ABC transporter substrate-binding protein [Paraburkholderia caballeronis]PXW28483.1 NitT/TauT family transport system substrate-binding protein/sulfonate transport system substrate-binding protein [Paraburkholderia caballeronis]PXX03849.1 NitT/TauT family transport system substrate-binding protein/sulfonate transport system substrate-binding protein [Paraburkholderia caballeronis]RAK04593.1 NitT/TauT family transport system substrate-binding protein/sulfonate transport sys
MQSSRRRFLRNVSVAALGAATLPAARAADARTLRIGYQKFNTLNILKGTGNLERALQPLGWSVHWAEFAAGPQLTEALNAGALDFGHAADTPSAFANAAGVNAVYLGAEQPYPKGIGIFVPADSPLRSIRDLKGKKVAIGRGWNVQYLLVRALNEAGLQYGDIQPVYLTSAADVSATYLSKNVDAAGLWDPFLASQQIATAPRILRDGTGLSNNRTFHLARPSFVNDNPDVIRVLFQELKKTNAWTQSHPQETADLLAPQLGVKPDVLRLSTERRHYTTVAVTPDIVKEQQDIVDTFHALGLVKERVDVARFVYPHVLV